MANVCAICQSEIRPEKPVQVCPECQATYHVECWEYVGGCAVYGCKAVPVTEPLSALEVAPAHWGQEHKPCAACGAEILASAIRCRHCGALFETAEPEDPEHYCRRREETSRLPGLRRGATWLLILGIVPCTAPLAAIGGILWYRGNRDILQRLTGLPAAMWRVGLAVALAQTLLLLLVWIVYPVFGG